MTNFSLGDWALIAEITACVMVVVSLIYGIIEYNQKKLIDRSEIDAKFLDRWKEILLLRFSNDEVASIFAKLETQPELLTDSEKNRLKGFAGVILNDWEASFMRNREGRMSSDSWKNWNGVYSKIFAIFPKFMWEYFEPFYPDEEFRALVEKSKELENVFVK